jgi:integrase
MVVFPAMRITKQSQVLEALPGRHHAGSSLFLVVSEDGRSRRWVFRFTKPSTRKRTELGLGSAHVVTFADALAEALKQRKVVAEGKDPAEEKRKVRREQITFGEDVEGFITAKKPGWREKHCDTMRRLLTDHAGALTSKSVKDVTVDDIEAALRPLLLRSRDQFKRTQAAISQVFDFAMSHEHCESNPADWRRLKYRFPNHRPVVKHFKAMDYMEVPPFVRDLHKEQQRNVALSPTVIEFLVLTACRSNEVTQMKWSEVDLDSKIWTVPAERTKAARDHRVPLSERAVALLELKAFGNCAQLPKTSDAVWSTDGKRPISNKAIYLYLTRTLGLTVTLHGFRSAFRDWAGNETSFDRVTCELALAHKAGDATELAYRRSDALAKRRALMDAWSAYCESGSDPHP